LAGCLALFVSVSLTNLLAQTSSDVPTKDSSESKPEEVVKMPAVVVTGSYIPRDSYADIGSPVNVRTSIDIDRDAGFAKVSDFMRYIPQNLGNYMEGNNATNSATADALFGGGSVNLRGFGNGATLVLLNGHRMTREAYANDGHVDINSLAPSISIARVETLLDGASALYGADAVAGVANFITRDDFSGVEVRGTYRIPSSYPHAKQHVESFMVGGRVSDRLHVVAAVEYMNQTALGVGNDETRLAYDNTATDTSGNAFPGNFNVPLRDANGNLTGKTIKMPDPDGAAVQAAGITTNPAGMGSDAVVVNGVCRQTFKFTQLLFNQHRWIGRISFTAKLPSEITIKGDFGATTAVVNLPSNAVGPPSVAATIPGTNPGNTFRAVNSLGQPLYAVPSSSNPNVPLLDSNGNAVLTSNPTNSASGIPFNENVVPNGFRALSTTNYPMLVVSEQSSTVNGSLGISGKINESWNWNLLCTNSWNEMLNPSAGFLQGNYLAGIVGQLQIGGTNYYYNPFANSLFAKPGAPRYNNPVVLNSMAYVVTNQYWTTLSSFEGVVTGKVGRLPGGPIGIALGAQHRYETLKEWFDKAGQQGLLSTNFGSDILGKNTIDAVFAEVSLPLLKIGHDKLELTVAGRTEKDSWTSATKPKFSVLYQHDWLSLRGSYSMSFLAPSLYQRFGDANLGGISGLLDPVTGVLVQPQVHAVGTVAAQPQSSRAYSFGATATPTKNLSLSITYWKFKFRDLLETLTPQAYLTAYPTSPNVIRNAIGTPVQMSIPFFNAGAINTDGLDLEASYKISLGNAGHLGLFVAAAEVNSYNVWVLPTSAVYEGVGKDNTNNFGFPVAKWRVNDGMVWDHKEQSASLTHRYISRVYVSTALPQSAHPQNYFDLQYNYDLHKIIPGLKATVGVLNLLNHLPNAYAAAANSMFMANLQVAIPRRVYITMDYTY
jgi:iron complex outermembrane receptor protein